MKEIILIYKGEKMKKYLNYIFIGFVFCLLCCPYVSEEFLVGSWGTKNSGKVYKTIEFTKEGEMILYDINYFALSDNPTEYEIEYFNSMETTGSSTEKARKKCFTYSNKIDYWMENNYCSKATVNYQLSNNELTIPEMKLNNLSKM